MARTSSIQLDTSVVTEGLRTVEGRLREAIRILTDVAAKKMEGWAKSNARWIDRTGNARQGIKGEAVWINETVISLALSHSVDYGIWLELAHEKKYAILEEAIEQYKDELIAAYKRLVGA